MYDTDLQLKFSKKTKNPVFKTGIHMGLYYTDEYVRWLESKIFKYKNTEMENELNYLSEKIEELSMDRSDNETESRRSENTETRAHHNDRWTKLNKEIELLENILSAVTEYALK